MAYYFKGNFTDNLSIDVGNLALLRGYCAFEYLRTYNKKPFCLKAHLKRFLFSIEQMGLNIDYSLEELEDITYNLIGKEAFDCGIKWYATGGMSLDGLRHGSKADVFAFSIPMTTPNAQFYKEGIKTETFKIQRPLPEAKTTAYFQACQILSKRLDLQEIIYLSDKNTLLEASTSNLFLIKNNTIYTAQKDVLHGITREVVIGLIKDKYKLVYEEVPYMHLGQFDEVFITATNKEVLPVTQIDSNYFKIGPVTQSIMDLFSNLTKSHQLDSFIPPLYQNELLLKS
jgi:branched-chain amino acid aminotransferase